MTYLIGKIVLSLLASLAIGFGMAWALQMHLAARLREQLNSVIFETKSRIPQLESEITNRDQVIDGLKEDLAKKPKEAPANNQAGSKEQEKQIDELRQQVIDLETELKAAKGTTHNESVFELDEEDRVHTEEPELQDDDEFLNDIQDIFDDGEAAADETEHEAKEKAAEKPEQESHQSLEEELQSELESWDDEVNHPAQHSAENIEKTKEGAPGSVDLKAELLGLKDEMGADSASDTTTVGTAKDSQQDGDLTALLDEVESLTEARKELNDTVDSQAKELSTMRQQRELQDKSLGVLNQQLELARMANERILRELREVKDATKAANSSTEIMNGDEPHSASGG